MEQTHLEVQLRLHPVAALKFLFLLPTARIKRRETVTFNFLIKLKALLENTKCFVYAITQS